jgi:DNA-binding MarR family transcriptional regulator
MEKPHTNIIVGLLRIGAFLQREGDRIVKDFDLNQQQYVVLNYISINQPLNQNDICSRLLYEKSNVSKIVKKLVALKYVTQSPSNRDKRYIAIACTDQGIEVIKQGNLLFDQFNKKLFESLPKSEIKVAENLINNLQKIIR